MTHQNTQQANTQTRSQVPSNSIQWKETIVNTALNTLLVITSASPSAPPPSRRTP